MAEEPPALSEEVEEPATVSEEEEEERTPTPPPQKKKLKRRTDGEEKRSTHYIVTYVCVCAVCRPSTDFLEKYQLKVMLWEWRVDYAALVTISEPLYLQIEAHLSGITMDGWTDTEMFSELLRTLRLFDVIDENNDSFFPTKTPAVHVEPTPTPPPPPSKQIPIKKHARISGPELAAGEAQTSGVP